MQPFPRKLWARIQATAASLSADEITGHILIRLNYLDGRISTWELQAGEHSAATSS